MSDIWRDQLDDIYVFAVELGKQAGKMLMDAAQLRISSGHGTGTHEQKVQKENAVDLVTETDESEWMS